MLFQRLGMCSLVLLIPLHVVAQQTPKTLDDLTQEIQKIQTTLKTTSEDLSKLAAQVAANTQATTTNAAETTRLAGVLNDEITKRQELLDHIDRLIMVQQDQLTQQQAILDSIAGKDSSGNDVIRLSANMSTSEEFRQEMRQAVNDSLDKKGEVIIHNRMQSLQQINVNQTEYSIPAGDSLTLKVPVGTLTVKLPGQKLTNWTVTAPEYKQKIDIVPDTQTTVTTYRPISTEPTVPLYTGPVETYYVDPAPTYIVPLTGWYSWPY